MARRRYNDWGYFPKTKPRTAENGIKARTKRGRFGENWWAQRWIAVLESFEWDSRLQRGRTYARKGQVIDIDVQLGVVEAHVQGSRFKPYTVRINIRPLSKREWEKAIDAMSGQAIFAAQLLGGEMPPNIEEAFRAAGVSLFPTRFDIEMNCSCPDWVVPCKHIAAVYYLLGEEFDRDPFLIFRLRGQSRDEVMAGLRRRRAANAPVAVEAAEETEAPDPEPLNRDLARFWEPRGSLAGFHIDMTPPPVELALLKRLGTPEFTRRPAAFVGALTLTYSAVSKRALRLAFGDEED
jgi:uncharacterized Zn finger protein